MTASAATNIVTSNLTYTITVTNFGPSSATNVVVNDLLPGSAILLGATYSQGSVTNVGSQFTWNVGSMAKDGTAALTITIEPTLTGSLTNTATVSTGTSDPNPDDDTASVITAIVDPTADLALGLTGLPNPLYTGYLLTYTIVVTNLGIGTAPGVTIADTLPANVSFVSAGPGAYTLVGRSLTFLNAGTVGRNGQITNYIVVKPLVPGTLTNVASCSSGVVDPAKTNNIAAVKTIVQAFQANFGRTGSTLTIAWPADAPNTYLEYTTNLRPPATWIRMTPPWPPIVNGYYTTNIPIGSGSQYFRLHGATP